MKITNYISIKEHKLLLTFAFIAFIFVISTFTFQAIKSYNDYVSDYQEKIKSQANGNPSLSFSGSNGTYQIAGLHFLTLFIFLSLIKTKRFLLPFILTSFYFIVFIYGLYYKINYSGFDSPKFINSTLFNQIYLVANLFDYIAFVFISILLFWQTSILLRMLIKTSQRKNVLP